jgi:hypothetical protein
MTELRKLPECYTCRFYAYSAYLVCAEHPFGIEGDRCQTYAPNSNPVPPEDDPLNFYAPLEQWRPLGAAYYGGELIYDPVKQLMDAQRLELLDTHPMFTGRCPECEMPLLQTDPPRVHWDCEYCGWKDDSV